MFKRLMIGLFALSLAVIWVSEANALFNRRRSVGVVGTFLSSADLSSEDYGYATDVPFDVNIYGLQASLFNNCGEVTGDLFCAQYFVDPAEQDAAIQACNARTGGGSALVAVLDKDAIPPDWPQDWFNFNLKDQGQRLEFQYGKDNFPPTSTFFIPAGDRRSVGWIFITDEGVGQWMDATTYNTISKALHRFTGLTWDSNAGKYLTDADFGLDNEKAIAKVPLEGLYGEALKVLKDQFMCIVWHHDELKWQGDSLRGPYYGDLAVQIVGYDKAKNAVEARIMSVRDVCGGLLYNNPRAGAAGSSSEYECLVDKAVVFAPKPYSETVSVDAFAMDPATAETKCQPNTDQATMLEFPWACQATVEVVSDGTDGLGNDLCSGDFPVFVEFIPIDNSPNPPNTAPRAFNEIAVIDDIQGVTTSGLENEVLGCKEGAGSLYECSDISSDDIPTCYGAAQRPWTINESYDDDPCN